MPRPTDTDGPFLPSFLPAATANRPWWAYEPGAEFASRLLHTYISVVNSSSAPQGRSALGVELRNFPVNVLIPALYMIYINELN
jgi:hypothetical protein